jgi:hypothetical protein
VGITSLEDDEIFDKTLAYLAGKGVDALKKEIAGNPEILKAAARTKNQKAFEALVSIAREEIKTSSTEAIQYAASLKDGPSLEFLRNLEIQDDQIDEALLAAVEADNPRAFDVIAAKCHDVDVRKLRVLEVRAEYLIKLGEEKTFICPISAGVIHDPINLPGVGSGGTPTPIYFERSSIDGVFSSEGPYTHPSTRGPITRGNIQEPSAEYLAEHGSFISRMKSSPNLVKALCGSGNYVLAESLLEKANDFSDSYFADEMTREKESFEASLLEARTTFEEARAPGASVAGAGVASVVEPNTRGQESFA